MSARTDALLRVEREVGVLLRRVRRAIGERARAVHPDLQPSAYLMLGHVREHGPLRASVMCTVFDMDKGAVSRQVQHLIDLGLVSRQPDPTDGRATLISVTDDAVRRLDAIAEERRAVFDQRMADWSAAEVEELAEALERYNRTLGT